MKIHTILLKTITGAAIFFSCSKSVLDKPAPGWLNPQDLTNKTGVDGLLIGAYSLLDGVGSINVAINDSWQSAGSNWVYGSVCGTEAHKGSSEGDQPDMGSLEEFKATSFNPSMAGKWATVYDGVQRCNDVLRIMRLATDIKPADTVEIRSEALFLRAHYHFEAKKIWNHVPFVDESVTYDAGNYKMSNEADIWPHIEDDLEYAIAHLPGVAKDIGRANHYSAEALLAKVYMFQGKYDSAKTLLTDIISSGHYQLSPHYGDNFNAEKQNNQENIFVAETSVNDGSGGMNGNYGDIFNYPNSGPVGCCGFFQPSQFMVNHFKTDPVSGLPNLDENNLTDIPSDYGKTSGDAFTPYAGTVDPRLDWTVGRRGIPYLDWGLHPGADWIVDQSTGGPYSPIKNMYYKSQQGIYSDRQGWTTASNAIHIGLIRYADVLLWAAEAEVFTQNGSLAKAQEYVNQVRMRAADPGGWVYQYKNAQDPSQGFSDTPAANYKINPYPGVWTDPLMAIQAIRYERMLELGMEGHRFFDLVRWGIAANSINTYLSKEKSISGYLSKSVFVAGKNEYFPIPQSEIDKSDHLLIQNHGYF